MRITSKSHPSVFATMQEVDYDNGAVNSLEPERKYYEVPPPWESLLETSEKWLGTLSEEDRNDFATGERQHIEDDYLENPGFAAADRLLNASKIGRSRRPAMQSERANADALVATGKCPCCFGTGLEDGTGQACGSDAEDMDDFHCVHCEGYGCGGSCSWCGGTGLFSAWKPGNPSYRGIISDNLLPEGEYAE